MKSPATPEIADALSKHPFFARFNAEELAQIAACGEQVQFAAGDFITHEGQDARHFIAVIQGQVAIQTFVPGRGHLTLQTLRGGDVLGWSWVFEPRQWTFDARAVSATQTIRLDGRGLLWLCEQKPHIGYCLMRSLAHVMTERLRATRMQVLDIYASPGGPDAIGAPSKRSP